MRENAIYTHDLFISYARDDLAWVHGYLLPSLGLPVTRVITEQDFAPEDSRVAGFERAIQNSCITVLVYSPAFPADEWTDFSERLASQLAVESQREQVILILLQPSAIPLRLQPRFQLDCTDPANWQDAVDQLRAFLSLSDPQHEHIRCPYPGMAPFRQADAHRFFGREAETLDLRRRLDLQSLLLVMGPSGSGKSSLLNAGLIPSLPADWTCLTVRPGERPYDALVSTLSQIPGTEGYLNADYPTAALPSNRVLLVVDQLEELFVQSAVPVQGGGDQAAAFMKVIRKLQESPGWTVILALRADFYSDFMNSPLWTLAPERFEITPLRGESLRPVIQRPANDLKVYLEAGLVEKLIADAADEPGVLPLLQQTMVLLWERRRRRLLPRIAYESLGDGQRSGLATAVALRADECLSQLSLPDQLLAQRVFMRLVAFGEGRADTRRQQTVSALMDIDPDQHRSLDVIEHLADYRLLTLGEKGDQQTADIAHDALITGWPTLGEWLRKWRAAELARRRFEAKAEEWSNWVAMGQARTGLLDSVELAEAEVWLASDESSQLGCSQMLQALVEQSRSAINRSRWIRLSVISTVIILIIAVAASIAISQSQLANERTSAAATAQALAQAESRARMTAESEVVVRKTAEAKTSAEVSARATAQAATERERNTAVARQLAAQATAIEKTLGQLDVAVLLAVESLRRDMNPDASFYLQQTLDRLLPPLFEVSFSDRIVDAVFAEDGNRLAVATADQKIHVLTLPTGSQVAELSVTNQPTHIEFCRDNAMLIAVEPELIELMVSADASETRRIPVPKGEAAIEVDPTCRWLIRNVTTPGDINSELWDLQHGRQVMAVTDDLSSKPLRFTPDGKWLLNTSGALLKFWEPGNTRPTTTLELKYRIRGVAIDNDSTRAAVTYDCIPGDGNLDCNAISIIDIGLKKLVKQLGVPNIYSEVSFSPDGSLIAGVAASTITVDTEGFAQPGTTTADMPPTKITVWRTDTYSEVVQGGIPTHHMVFHPVDPLVLSSVGGLVSVWDGTTGRVLQQFDVGRDIAAAGWVGRSSPGWVTTIPAQQTCTTERCVQALEVWDVRSGTLAAQLSPPSGDSKNYSVDPTDRYAIISSGGNTLVAWELPPRKFVALDATTAVPDMYGLTIRTSFSDDGAWLAASHGEGDVYLWELSTGTGTDGTPWYPTIQTQGGRRDYAVSPNSKWLAAYSEPKTCIEIWSFAEGVVKYTVPLDGTPIGFSQDSSKLIASEQKDGVDTVVVWDIARSSEVVRFRAPPLDSYNMLNTEGTRLAIEELLDAGGIVHVYDVAHGEEIMQVKAKNWAMDGSGTLLALVGPDNPNELELWSIDAEKILAKTEIHAGAAVKFIAFTDRAELIIATDTVSVRQLPDLAETASWSLGDVLFPKLSRDGQWLLATQGIANTNVMDVHTGRRIAKLWVPGATAYQTAFSRDNERVVVEGANGEKRVLLWQPQSLIFEACRRLTRNLTEWEWSMYLPDEPYRKTCPELP